MSVRRKSRNALVKAGGVPEITKAHKAAIVLASLNEEAAKEIVGDISDEELRSFATAFSELKDVPPDMLQTIAAEFLEEAQQSANVLSGGSEEARRVLTAVAEEDRIERVMSGQPIAATPVDSAEVWERVEGYDDKSLAEYIENERLPVAATILSMLSIDKTAAVLTHADSEFSKTVLLELARRTAPAAQAVNDIAAAIDEALFQVSDSAPTEGSSGPNAGAMVGEIINFLPSEKRDAFMTYLSAADAEVGKEAMKSIITFESLYQRVPEAAAPALLREVAQDVMMTALKFGETNAEETVNFLLGNISKRMAEQYREELAEKNEVEQEDGETAQREFIKAMRRMAENGEFELNELPDPEAETADSGAEESASDEESAE